MPHSSRASGFTLVELIIVVAVLVALATFTVTVTASSRISANEAAAIAMLKRLRGAQTALIVARSVDGDGDGIGEYGYFEELAAAKGTRVDLSGDGITDQVGADRAVATLPAGFGKVDSDGMLTRSGYVFRIALPGAAHEWLWEEPLPGTYPPVRADHAEAYWGCYAWPSTYGASGRRGFFINQNGVVLACGNGKTRYSGKVRSPAGDAVTPQGGAIPGMNGPVAVDAIGRDLNHWKPVH